MKNYFFVNPKAGQGRGIKQLVSNISNTSEKLGIASQIYMTKCVGDGESRARKIAEELNGEEARIYCCGGDGTTSEIINGVVDFDNVSVGCIPIGTGNDTVRNFKASGDFLNIESQLKGDIHKIDLIKYSGVINGYYQEKYCVNMFNIGFDCNVVELAARLKEKPMVEGHMAYLLAVMGIFIQKKEIDIKVIADGQVVSDEMVLFCSIANGSYCGGGIYSSPQAIMDDGYFDLNIVKDVTRREFIKLFPKYKKGTHLQAKEAKDIIKVKKCTKVTLIPKEDNFFLCADGEINLAQTIDFDIAPRKLNFIVPAAL